MAQPPPPQLAQATTAPASPPSQFAPRREFIRDQHTFSTFALLALSGTSFVRLYSFPTSVIAALRQSLTNRKLLSGFREDATQNLCEFMLEGRPWGMAKNIKTEKLIVEIVAVVFRHGFEFLSTIDYGREQDDRIALAFSRPASLTSSPRSASPISGVGSGPQSLQPRGLRVPFAISFSSTTVMRVINPPLHSTPAILQAVRNSWPRGVVDEKKTADTCFEFKLKGYRWFQEDTFATDSLRHILMLLASLDAHGFKLASSLTLANRSRIKDLWMFTGPSSETALPDSPSLSGTPTPSSLELRRAETPESSGTSQGSGTVARHARNATSPAALPSAPPRVIGPSLPAGHSPTPFDPPSILPPSPLAQSHSSRSVLRKPTPKTQTPPGPPSPPDRTRARSFAPDEPLRTSLPSEVGSAVNMTGVGTMKDHAGPLYDHEVIYETSGEPADEDLHLRELPTPPGQYVPHEQGYNDAPRSHGGDQARVPSAALLSPGAFRDTAFTSSTGWRSTEVPIAWSGDGPDPSAQGRDSGVGIMDRKQSPAVSPGTRVPGAWMLTPAETRRDDPFAVAAAAQEATRRDSGSHSRARSRTPERQHVDARVAGHELAHSPRTVRKSEAGIVGVIPEYAGRAKERPEGGKASGEGKASGDGKASGEGWVLVNVEAKDQGASQGRANGVYSPRPPNRGRSSSDSHMHGRSPSPREASPGPAQMQASMSAAAKAIVIIDAVEAKKGNQTGTVAAKDGSGLKRFFSIHKTESSESSASTGSLGRQEREDGFRAGLKDRFRKKTPQESPAPPPTTWNANRERRMSLE